MNRKTLGILIILLTLSTYIWLVVMVVDISRGEPIITAQDAIIHLSDHGWSYSLTYINAAIITVLTVMVYAGLYVFFKQEMPFWSRVGLVFIPIYGTFNLIVYLSQVTIVPRLLGLRSIPEYSLTAEALLALTSQLWDGSVVSVLNLLAYAVLSIPIMIFAFPMLKRGALMKVAGIIFIFSSIGSLLGFIGVIMNSRPLMSSCIISGALYCFALIPLSIAFMRKIE